MEQTIKINVPEGKIARYNEETQTIEFVDKEPIRSKSWEEFCKNHPFQKTEWYVSSYGTIETYETIEEMSYIPNEDKRTNVFSNALETKEDAEGIIALIQLTRLHDEWVGDWKPVIDTPFSSITCSKYNGELFIECNNHRLLIFPTLDMAIEFKNCFKYLLLKAKKFI